MSRFPDYRTLAAAALAVALVPATLWAKDDEKPAGHWGFGEPATAEQIAGWDIDIRPDGTGLPPGSGSVEDGEMLYEEQCAECHGSFGEGEGRHPALAGGEGSLQDERPTKTVGSYWPYASTLWDYIHRAMPFREPQSLTDDEVYAISAYVLYLNELVEDDFVLTQDNLADIRMPNVDSFIPEERPNTHNKRCMKNCRDPKAITIKSEAPLYRPEPTTLVAETSAAAGGKITYTQSCAVCHKTGTGGAPVMGEAFDWRDRIGQGMDTLYRHALEGFQGEDGVMPPKGGFMNLGDDEVKAAVDYMVEQSQ
jgi:S-disulfanyl-L-cysteine oxidoreductase SoxD